MQIIGKRGERHLQRCWPGEDHDIPLLPRPVVRPCGFAQQALRTIANNGSSKLRTSDKCNAARLRAAFLSGGLCENDEATARRPRSFPEDPVYLPRRPDGRRLHRTQALGAQDATALAAPGSEDTTSSLGRHTGAEAVCLAPLAVVWLIRALHESSDRFPRHEGKARRLYGRSQALSTPRAPRLHGPWTRPDCREGCRGPETAAGHFRC